MVSELASLSWHAAARVGDPSMLRLPVPDTLLLATAGAGRRQQRRHPGGHPPGAGAHRGRRRAALPAGPGRAGQGVCIVPAAHHLRCSACPHRGRASCLVESNGWCRCRSCHRAARVVECVHIIVRVAHRIHTCQTLKWRAASALKCVHPTVSMPHQGNTCNIFQQPWSGVAPQDLRRVVAENLDVSLVDHTEPTPAKP